MSQIEHLLEHREWLRDLARRLVSDSNVADDLAQTTWLAAIEQPPRDTSSPRAWLATVLRSRLHRSWRDDATKCRHEHAAARGEAVPGPAEMVARAEEMRRVVDAVLRLDEPYRTTLLYRHHEGLPPREIAARMDVPVETVRTRVKRGLAMVRADLDAQHGGDGRRWALALLPLTTMPVGPAPATRAPTSAGPGGGTAARLLEGLIVKATTKTAAAVALLLLCLLGGTAALVATSDGGGAPRTDVASVPGAGTTERVRVHATPERRAAASSRDDDARSGTDDAPQAPDRTIEVLVLDSRGAPVPGARVELHRQTPVFLRWGTWEKAEAMFAGSAPSATAVTDAEGRVVLTEAASAALRLVVRADGFAVSDRFLGSADPQRDDEGHELIVEHLEEGCTVAGRLLRADGAPAAGVLLRADPYGDERAGVGTENRGVRATTGPDGSFRFDGLRRGVAHVYLGAVPIAQVRVPLASPLTLRLGGQTLTGKVTLASSGAPLAGVVIDAERMSFAMFGVVRTTTRADGTYELPLLVDGTYLSLRLTADGLTEASRSKDVDTELRFGKDCRARLDFTMEPGAVVSGRIVAGGAPVPGIGVMVLTPNGRSYRTDTDADGRYELTGLPGGRALLVPNPWHGTLRVPGWAPDLLSRLSRGEPVGELGVTLTPGEATTRDVELADGTIGPTSTAPVSGVVRDAGGAPVGGATVDLGGATRATTAADGTFRLEGRITIGLRIATASHGALRGRAPVDIREDGATGIEITLRAPTRIAATIVDLAGAPVPAAYVQVLEPGRTSPSDPFPWNAAERVAAPDGRCEVSSCADGTLRLRAAAPGFATSADRSLDLSAEGGEETLRFVLARAPTVRGRVRTSAGVAVAGAAIRLHEGEVLPASMAGSRFLSAATTDTDGGFEVAALQPGLWTIVVDAEGMVLWHDALRVAEDTVLDVVCERALAIAGEVRVPTGQSPAAVQVWARRDGAGPGEPGFFESAVCREDGTFELSRLPSGTYSVEARPSYDSNLSVSRKRVEGIPAGTTGLVLEMPAAGTISGVVRDADGAPAADAHVSATAESGPPRGASTRTDESGAFTLTGLVPGTGRYTVWARPPEPRHFATCETLGRHTARKLEGVEIGRADLDVALPLGKTITGSLCDADGEPIPGAWVFAECVTRELEPRRRTWTRGPAVQADADGRFRFQGLPEAEFALFRIPDPMTDGSGARSALSGGERVAAGTSGLVVRLAPTGSLRGRVVDETGAALPAARVYARPQGDDTDSSRLRADVAGDGTFELTGMTETLLYDVDVRADGMVPHRVKGVRAGGAALHVTMTRGGAIAGRLIVPDGESAAHRIVRLRLDGGDFESTVETGPDGAFEAKALEPGRYRIELRTNPNAWPAEHTPVGTATTGQSDVVLRVE